MSREKQTDSPGDIAPLLSAENSSELYEIAIGPKNTAFYLEKFQRFDSGASRVSWNWPSFFVTFYWFLYRKMWVWAIGYWLLPTIFFFVLALFFPQLAAVAGLINIAYILGIFLLIPMFSNSLYHRHIKSIIEKVTRDSSDLDGARLEIARRGGTSAIIAIIVLFFFLIFVLGIVAAIAIPAYQDYTVRARVSEGFALAEGYKQTVNEYTYRMGRLPASADDLDLREFVPSEVVQNIAIEDDGVIVVTLDIPPLVQSQSFSLTPELEQSGQLSWVCTPIDIPNKYLPVGCRN